MNCNSLELLEALVIYCMSCYEEPDLNGLTLPYNATETFQRLVGKSNHGNLLREVSKIVLNTAL